MKQNLIPKQNIFFAGDIIKIEFLSSLPNIEQEAYFRTNIGSKSIYNKEIIEEIEQRKTPQNLDWHDIKMIANANGLYTLEIPLLEVGSFSGKCYIKNKIDNQITWAEGENFYIKVEPASSISNNTIYTAFVRQFGPYQYWSKSPDITDAENYLTKENYTVLPPSGTFRALKKNLSHIFDKLNCKILQLLPIHPVPVEYARMGRIGSPFAALDYFAVDPALAEFDTKVTPMEQFCELIDAVHSYGGKIFMDIPVNHTGWASKLQQEHPEYFIKNADGSFQSPGAWGITWEDLCALDYSKNEVIQTMANVFLFWCKKGIDGFRCDAGYMVPIEAWKYITSKVRIEYPETIFFLEGLGGKLEVQDNLLKEASLNWAYSELFQNYTQNEITNYFPTMAKTSQCAGNMISFAETHDNLRLASSGKTFAKLRFAITALLSPSGGFGFTNGGEFFATEKIDVHRVGALNWNSDDNLVEYIAKLNTIITRNSAFGPNSKVEFIHCNNNNVIAVKRSFNDNLVLLLFNLDCHNSTTCSFYSINQPKGIDLLSDEEVYIDNFDKDVSSIHLASGQARCIVFDDFNLNNYNTLENNLLFNQKLSFMARNLALKLAGEKVAISCNVKLFYQDIKLFLKEITNQKVAPIVVWNANHNDFNRVVIIPPGNVLYLIDNNPFRVEIKDGNFTKAALTSLPTCDGKNYFAVYFLDNNDKQLNKEHKLTISYTGYPNKGVSVSRKGTLLFLSSKNNKVQLSTNNFDDTFAFGNNSLSSYGFIPSAWGSLNSKYNAILACNSNMVYPDDRYVMFTRCRIWVLVNGYSKELDKNTCKKFTSIKNNHALWNFEIPISKDVTVSLDITYNFALEGNAARLSFKRVDKSNVPLKLILRPDLEDRVNHQVTQAFTGPEDLYKQSVIYDDKSFCFGSQNRKLKVISSKGKFVKEIEWQYMQFLPFESDYGLDCYTDLFSPGYFEVELLKNSTFELTSFVSLDGSFKEQVVFENETEVIVERSLDSLLEESLSTFIVKREELNTVIAGFPWFLDWGRDTLIALRGMVKNPLLQPKVAQIIKTFAKFEENGTIPNMICGNNVSNRDTSDAPLYLIIAIKDYCNEIGNKKILEEKISDERKLLDVLTSIVENYINGTFNGIKADKETLLIYSPAHFTWMDTNHPAGTPRQGYPIEIQCLWYAALEFLGYKKYAQTVSMAIEKYFFFDHQDFASDCLHCGPNTSPANAIADDHLRCNQLLGITLNAVKNPILRERILLSSQELLVPGGIRTLADRVVKYHLPIKLNNNLLNNPENPYQGKYHGPEDTSRKIAYHNGTAWVWPFPAYCEALFIEGGISKKDECLAILNTVKPYLESGILGQLPEVLDGDAPHKAGGCAAQAWSVTEVYRVKRLLS